MSDDVSPRPFDVANYLRTPKDIASYLQDALENGHEAELRVAAEDAVRCLTRPSTPAAGEVEAWLRSEAEEYRESARQADGEDHAYRSGQADALVFAADHFARTTEGAVVSNETHSRDTQADLCSMDDPQPAPTEGAASPSGVVEALKNVLDGVDQLCNELWGGDIPDPLGGPYTQARELLDSALATPTNEGVGG